MHAEAFLVNFRVLKAFVCLISVSVCPSVSSPLSRTNRGHMLQSVLCWLPGATASCCCSVFFPLFTDCLWSRQSLDKCFDLLGVPEPHIEPRPHAEQYNSFDTLKWKVQPNTVPLFHTGQSRLLNLSYEKPKANLVSWLFTPSVAPQASPISALPGEDLSG